MTDETIIQPGPRRIGKYLVEETLGEGAMGVVYKARDPDIDRTVAVKVIREAGLGPEMRQEFDNRFRREAKAAGRLNHPGIVAVYDFGRDEGLSYLAMEYVEGRSLADALREDGDWPVDRILEAVQNVLAALGHAHAQGVVHRDIKPDNVLLPATGGVKLTDFGIARLEEASLTQSGTVLGTPYYMAPEQVQGRKVTPATDLYAVGVILYEMLAGERPFTGTATSLTQKILHQTPVRPSLLNVGVPAWLDAVVARAMAKAPADRFQDADSFAEALQGAGASPQAGAAAWEAPDRTAVAGPPGREGGDRRPRRSGPPAAVVAGIALLALAGLGYGGWLAFFGEEDKGSEVVEAPEPPGPPPESERADREAGAAPEPPADTAAPEADDPEAEAEAAREAERRAEEEAAREAERRAEAEAEAEAERRAEDEAAREAERRADADTEAEGEAEAEAAREAERTARAEAEVAREAERRAWAEAERRDTAEAYRSYLEAYPDGADASAAEDRLAELEAAAADAEAWAAARDADSIEALLAYLDAYPAGIGARAAVRRIAELEAAAARDAFDRAMAEDTPEALRRFVRGAPTRDLAAEAERRLAELDAEAWEAAERSDTEAALDRYLDDFPDGAQADDARERLAEIARAREAEVASRPPDPGPASRPEEQEPDRGPSPAEVEAALGLSPWQRLQIQRALDAAGQPVGAADGVFGPRTRSAIGGWQRETGAPPTGYLTPDQSAALQEAAAALPPPAPPEPAEPAPQATSPAPEPPQTATRPVRPPPAAAPETPAAPDEPDRREEACVEQESGPRTVELSLRRVDTTGSRSTARRQCNSQVDAQLLDCQARGGRIEPYNPVCQCETSGRMAECSFDPRGRIPPFTCVLPERAVAAAGCP